MIPTQENLPPLPRLREDLRLLPGPAARDGSPTWTIHDPVRGRYHRLSWLAFEMLARWRCGTAQALCERVAAETPLSPGIREVEELVNFLRANALVDMGAADRETWMRQAEGMRQHWSKWLLHNYLFFRIPLVRPERFLAASWPVVRPLFSRTAAILLPLLAALALVLVARQWDAFRTTFTRFANLEGLAYMGLALAASKVMHEMGHAYTAHRFGCRVPTMGVAFLVLWPVLYTDTSDAWRLTDRRHRLAIGAAGMAAELCVGVLAALLWVFLDEGPVRSAAFFLATAGWTTSLAVNLNPFMRFDGYYLLGDWLDEPNLQPRAFALGRWALRELLFALGDPPPEALPGRRRRLLVAYAWATWAYRLVLFLGIALLVYHFFIKLVGILLFAIEIGWFVAKPVTAEMRVWWQRRHELRRSRRSLGAVGGVLLALAALFVPWRSSVSLPAVIEAERSFELRAPEPARVAAVLVVPGHTVTAGQPLMVLEAPDLGLQLDLVRQRIALNRLTLARAVTDSEARSSVPLLMADLDKLMAEEAGYVARQERMTLTSTVDGEVADLLPGLRPGLWVDRRLPLLRVVGRSTARIIAYAGQGDLPRLGQGADARFYPDDALGRVRLGQVARVDTANRPVLDHPMLASDQGGGIAVRRDGERRLRPERSIYRVLVTVDDGVAPTEMRRGTLHVRAQPESLALRLWQAIARVLIRESGF